MNLSAGAARAQQTIPTKGPGNLSQVGQALPSWRATGVIGDIGAGSPAVGSIHAAGGPTALAAATAIATAMGGTAGWLR